MLICRLSRLFNKTFLFFFSLEEWSFHGLKGERQWLSWLSSSLSVMTISIMKGLSNLLLLWHAYILLAPQEDSKSSLVTICGQSEIAAVVFRSLYIIVDWCSHCIFLLPFLELNRLSYLASFSVQATMLDTSPWCKVISFYKQSLCEGEVVVWGCLTNSWEKKRSKWQRRKGKIYPTEYRVPTIARRD